MRIKSLSTAILACAVACAMLPGCVGQTARQSVALPLQAVALEGVEQDIGLGIAELPEADRQRVSDALAGFAAAIRSGDRSQIASTAVPAWPELKAVAEAGFVAQIARGELGPGPAASLRLRLARFEGNLIKLSQRL